MQSLASKPLVSRPVCAFRGSRTSSINIRCHAAPRELVKDLARNLALTAAAFSLLVSDPSYAKVVPSTYEQKKAYEAELIAALQARTGKTDVLPALKASPKGSPETKQEMKAFKLESAVPKGTIETPSSVPAPEPRKPAEVAAAPSIAATKANAPVAPSSPSPSSASQGSPNSKVIGAGAIIAVAAVAAIASQKGTGEIATAGGPSAPVGSQVPPNVAEARAWIAAWKAKHGKK